MAKKQIDLAIGRTGATTVVKIDGEVVHATYLKIEVYPTEPTLVTIEYHPKTSELPIRLVGSMEEWDG